MKFSFKSFVTGVLFATVALMCVPTIAKISTEPINVVYRNIKLVIDGVLYEPKDANGETVEPFAYNGTTFLPVRAVANAFDKEVEWDGENNTIYLGEKPAKIAKEVPLWDRPYTSCSSVSEMKTYKEDGLGYIKCSGSDGGEETTDGRRFRSYSIEYPLNGLAKTFSGSYYMPENELSTVEGVLKIYNGNEKVLYQSPIIRNSTAPINFNVNVENELSIKIIFEQTASWYSGYSNYSGAEFYIKNPVLVTADY